MGNGKYKSTLAKNRVPTFMEKYDRWMDSNSWTAVFEDKTIEKSSPTPDELLAQSNNEIGTKRKQTFEEITEFSSSKEFKKAKLDDCDNAIETSPLQKVAKVPKDSTEVLDVKIEFEEPGIKKEPLDLEFNAQESKNLVQENIQLKSEIEILRAQNQKLHREIEILKITHSLK